MTKNEYANAMVIMEDLMREVRHAILELNGLDVAACGTIYDGVYLCNVHGTLAHIQENIEAAYKQSKH